MEHLKEKLHHLENIEDGVNDDYDSPSSRNEDEENVELASEGLNVVVPLTCSAEESVSTRRVRGKKPTKGLSATIPGSLDFGSSPTVRAFRNKCNEVERLQGEIIKLHHLLMKPTRIVTHLLISSGIIMGVDTCRPQSTLLHPVHQL